jgi:uncharacterized membrane protein
MTTNFTNVNNNILPTVETGISSGLYSIFGSPVIIGVIGLFIIVALGYTLKTDLDTLILAFLTMIFIEIGVYLPEYVLWLIFISLGVYAGVVFSRTIHK